MEPLIHHVILGLEQGADSTLIRHHRLALQSVVRATEFGGDGSEIMHSVFVTQSGFDYSEWDVRILNAKNDARTVYGDDIRPLPIASEVFNCLAESSADVVVLSNADICLQPHFYDFVKCLYRAQISSWTAHRRTIPSTPPDGVDILQWAARQLGIDHQGSDLFITTPNVASRIRLGEVAMGMPGIGDLIVLNLAIQDSRFVRFSQAHVSFHFEDDRDWLRDVRQTLDQNHTRLLRKVVRELAIAEGQRTIFRRAVQAGLGPHALRKLGLNQGLFPQLFRR